MQNNPKDILQAIKTVLTASPSLVPNTLRAVRLGADADHSAGFPHCRLFLTDFTSEITDTVSTTRRYAFAVDVVQEFSQKTKENAELDLCNAIHAVLNRLEAQWQLGVGVENSQIETTPVQTVEVNGAPLRLARIRLTVTTLVQNPAQL